MSKLNINLLYIEDDREIGEWVSRDLKERGYNVTWLTSGETAVEQAASSSLVILDVMLPGLDGFTVGQRLKRQYPSLPVLMLSARTSIDDKLQGLEFGDDYLTKPFHPDELAARLEVLLRRHGAASAEPLQLRHLLVYEKENRIINQSSGEEIMLTGKQFHIFQYLLRHLGQIMTKEQIYEAVWGEPYFDGDKTLMVHIRHLREKLEQDPAAPEIIETIRGIGYRVRS
ncbi:DNA-binding response OmpR family regulator [Fontibacillus solani]|uniref:DNA-binding response regulator, OmpR family, contains REC and winged-helix (WHTH) domain n=2 Tax=Fontibacillus TaxID=995014 RepID=A0A1G7U282_9BACL|nr:MULTISPECIES: response regulator transcription factor [Fontibacillus]MBA9083903.1 DNA-binding response OmpR family regulator [Fontibacillus solani]SDG41149.1 DNA-binding response regulator, OmpR family, contains REC and winged-helix (wHTH) domain [Fontibacillus panacisegetis]